MAKTTKNDFDLDKILTECPQLTWDQIAYIMSQDLSKIKNKNDLKKLLKGE